MAFPRLKRLSVIAIALRFIARLIRQWPWLLLALIIIAPPTSPHLRWEYSYKAYGSTRIYVDCHYLGLRGIKRYARMGDCPMVIWLTR